MTWKYRKGEQLLVGAGEKETPGVGLGQKEDSEKDLRIFNA